MNSEQLKSYYKKLFEPPDNDDIVRWLENNVNGIPDSPMPGPFRAERTPWIAEALRIAADPETRLLTVLASIQSGKSLFARLFSCYVIANQPGPMMILQANDVEAKDFMLRYLRPLWKNTPIVQARISESDQDRSIVADFDRMSIYCRGIWNESNLQRLSLRYVLADECWLAPQGHLAEASARVTAFGWLGKRIFMSQGGKEGQEFHQLHESTDQRDWNFKCPSCGKLQPWIWDQIRFPEDAKEGAGWNLNKVSIGTTYECSGCSTRLKDNSATRLECNKDGMFVANSIPNSRGYIGLHWNSLASMSWGELAVMMIKASEANDIFGDLEPRRIFKQKRLAMPWSDDGGQIVMDSKASDYNLLDEWDKEAVVNPRGKVQEKTVDTVGYTRFRTAGVDVQRGHFWVVIRSWSTTGQSRLVAFSKIDTWNGVEDYLKKHMVNPALVFVDSGDNTQEVYRETAKRRWKCARGSGQEDFAVKDRDGKTIRRYYSEKQRILVPGLQSRADLVVWSNLAGKDLLHGLRSRKMHTYGRDASEEYVNQLNSEIRVKDKKIGKPIWILQSGKKDNHALDCELLCLLAAVRWGLVGRDRSDYNEDNLNSDS
jgi:hypothetical protein